MYTVSVVHIYVNWISDKDRTCLDRKYFQRCNLVEVPFARSHTRNFYLISNIVDPDPYHPTKQHKSARDEASFLD